MRKTLIILGAIAVCGATFANTTQISNQFNLKNDTAYVMQNVQYSNQFDVLPTVHTVDGNINPGQTVTLETVPFQGGGCDTWNVYVKGNLSMMNNNTLETADLFNLNIQIGDNGPYDPNQPIPTLQPSKSCGTVTDSITNEQDSRMSIQYNSATPTFSSSLNMFQSTITAEVKQHIAPPTSLLKLF